MLLGRLIDHDAHRAFGGVRADIDQAARETLVAHRRHRDQHLAVEIAALGPPLLRLDGRRRFHGRQVTPFPDSWESKLVQHRLGSDHGEFSGAHAAAATKSFIMSPKFQHAPRIVLGANLVVSVARARASPPMRRRGTATQRAAVRLIAGAARRRRRDSPSRRHRDPARAGLEDLLALSGRLRHSAALRFLEFAQREIRHGALAGAAAARRRERHLDRLQA